MQWLIDSALLLTGNIMMRVCNIQWKDCRDILFTNVKYLVAEFESYLKFFTKGNSVASECLKELLTLKSFSLNKYNAEHYHAHYLHI